MLQAHEFGGRGAHPRYRSFGRLSPDPELPALSDGEKGGLQGEPDFQERPWKNVTHVNGEIKGLKAIRTPVKMKFQPLVFVFMCSGAELCRAQDPHTGHGGTGV